MLSLPPDSPPSLPSPSRPGIDDIIDSVAGPATPDLVTEEDRVADFVTEHTWRGQPISFTIASELYYRDLRAMQHAPALGSYLTDGDYFPEAVRTLYCAHLSLDHIRALRRLSHEEQAECLEQWTMGNITLPERSLAVKTAQAIHAAITRASTIPMDSATTDNLDGLGN